MRNTARAKTLRKDLQRNWSLYLMVIPVILFYILFHYKPMYGTIIAFKNYRPADGVWGSDWAGLAHFIKFFKSPYFFRTVRNTFTISFLNLLFGFPAPIILALMMNEVRNQRFKRLTQTITYLPHFISTIVICGMVSDFCMSQGLFNDIIVFFGGERESLLSNKDYYRTIYVGSGIWQQIGWNSIIYLAALAGVDKDLYEAAEIDGAGKWKQMIHVTLPCIIPTIITMLILRIGQLMSVGYEKTLLLYNEGIYEVADIISTFVYRYGLENQSYSYATAVDLFNSVINCTLIVTANYISRKTTEKSLW